MAVKVSDIEEVEDSDEWEDLEPVAAAARVAPCTTRRFFFRGAKQATTTVIIRGDLCATLTDACVRVRVQLSSDGARLRIVPDDAKGRYEWSRTPGRMKADAPTSITLRLGFVSVWPNDARETVEATIRKDTASSGLIIEAPRDFIRPEAPKPAASPVALSARPAAPIAPGGSGVRAATSATIARRVVEPGLMSEGVPPPGRSALDQRRAASESTSAPLSISAKRRP